MKKIIFALLIIGSTCAIASAQTDTTRSGSRNHNGTKKSSTTKHRNRTNTDSNRGNRNNSNSNMNNGNMNNSNNGSMSDTTGR